MQMHRVLDTSLAHIYQPVVISIHSLSPAYPIVCHFPLSGLNAVEDKALLDGFFAPPASLVKSPVVTLYRSTSHLGWKFHIYSLHFKSIIAAALWVFSPPTPCSIELCAGYSAPSKLTIGPFTSWTLMSYLLPQTSSIYALGWFIAPVSLDWIPIFS